MKKGFLVLMVVVMALGATALPALADDPGTGNSDFVIQNVASTATEVRVDYYDQTGASDVSGTPITLNGNGSQVFEASTLPVGDGWIGSVVVSADQQVAAVTNLTWQSSYGSADDKITGGSYSGTYEPGTELYFPYATVKPVGSIAGKLNRFSIITVQNAGTGDAHINVYYYNQLNGSQTGPIADTIAAGRSKSYNLSLASDPKVPNLGGDWQGSVKVVSSDQPIAGVVTTHWAAQTFQQWASANQGVSGGATTLYGPSVFRVDKRTDPAVNSWVRSSNVMVQNLGGSTANVTVEFFATGSTTAAMTINDTIAPNTMGEYNTRFGSPTNASYPASAFETALGAAFNGSVKITCTNGQELASVVHTFWNQPSENAASTYQSVAGPGATDVYIPYAPRKKTGSAWVEWSKIAAQNLSGSTANITLNYYNPNGTSALVVNASIAGNSGDAYNTRFGSDSGAIPGSTFTPLGDNFIGGVHITSTQPLAAVVNLIAKPNWSSTYNAYTE
jgi:hypothetical protein